MLNQLYVRSYVDENNNDNSNNDDSPGDSSRGTDNSSGLERGLSGSGKEGRQRSLSNGPAGRKGKKKASGNNLDSSPDIGPAGSKGDPDSSREKVQGIYIGLDEFNRLIEERGADIDTSYLYKVSILYYTILYFSTLVCFHTLFIYIFI